MSTGTANPDVVVACELAHLIYFQNPGASARVAPWPRVIPTVTADRGSYIRVFLADVDGDGRLEAVAPNKGEQNPGEGANPAKPISVFEIPDDPRDGDRWIEHVLGRTPIPQNAHTIDLDGDGDTDVVGGSRGNNRIMWFENTGASHFRLTEHRIDIDGEPTGGFNLAFHDFNDDGRLDIVVAEGRALGQALAWLAQPDAPSGRWTGHPIGTFLPDVVAGLTVADINGDGYTDVIAGSYSQGPRDTDGGVAVTDALGRLGWFENPGDPAADWIRHDISRRKRGMFDTFVARDMDGDGDVDFISTRGNSVPYDGVFWLEQVRTKTPRPAFERARADDNAEVRLP